MHCGSRGQPLHPSKSFWLLVTSGQSSKKAALPPHMDGSIIFARWRQCAPHLKHASLDPPQFTPQTTSGSVQLFLHSARQRVPILYNGPLLPPQNCPFPWGSRPPSNTWFLAHLSPHPKQHLDQFSYFCRAHCSDRQTVRVTDHAIPSVTVGHIYAVL